MKNLQNMNEFTHKNGEKEMLNSFNSKNNTRYNYNSSSIYDKVIVINNNIYIF